MLPTCTSGIENVFARYFTPLAFTIVLSNAFPSKLATLPSGRIVRAFSPWTVPWPLKYGISTSPYFRPSSVNYLRVKILTEEGRKYRDVEIPYFKGQGTVHGLKARTIRPDGTIANFEGKAFDKTIVKAKGLKYLAKTFSMPDVQVGSIIEYHYTNNLAEGLIFDSHWILSEELFTRHAKFSLKPYPQFTLRWSWPAGLPVGTAPP